MATKNIVPRTDGEGKLGKSGQRWGQGNFVTGSFAFVSSSLIPDTTDSYNLGSAAKAWSKLYVITSSIVFVDGEGSTIQTLTANTTGFALGNISGSAISGSGLMVNGNANITGDLTLGGNITIGDAESDSITITADLSSSIIPDASDSYDLGSDSKRWNDFYLSGSLSASGGPVDIDSTTTVAIDATTTLSAKGAGGASFGDDVGTWEFDGAGALSETGMTTVSITPSSTLDIDAGGAVTIDGSAITIGGDSDVAIDMDASTFDVDASGAITIDGTSGISIDAAAASNLSTSAGLLTLSGNAGVQLTGNVTASGHISASGTIYADNFQSAGEDVGGISFADDLNITGDITASGNISSSLTSTGSFGAVTMAEVIGNWTNAGNTVADLGTVTTADINGGTVDGANVTVGSGKTLDVSGGTLTTSAAQKEAIMEGAGANIDIGAFDLRAATITPDGLTSGRVVFAGTNGVLSDDSDFTFSGETLTATSLSSTAITGSTISASGDVRAANLYGQVATAAQTNITSIYATDLILGEDSQTAIDFGTTNEIRFNADNQVQIKIADGVVQPLTDSDVDLGTSSVYWKDAFIDSVTTTGNVSGSLTSTGSFGRVSATDIDLASIKGNWTNAGNTVADLGTITTADINGGTIDGATIATSDVTVGSGKTLNVSAGTLTTSTAQKLAIVEGVGGDTDIGSHDFRAATLTADGLTSGRVVFAGTNGVLSDDSDLTFTGATLSATNLTTTGTIKDFTLVSGSSVSTGSFGNLTVVGGVTQTVSPLTSDGAALGTTSKMWSDLFLADGGVINFNNGDVTLTHSSNKVTLGGGDLDIDGAMTITGNITGDSGNMTIAASGGDVLIEGSTFSGNNVTIPGNLTVQGDQTSISSSNLDVVDKNITIASGSTTSALMDAAGLDFGVGGTVANLRYWHAQTAISSSVEFIANGARFGSTVSPQTSDGAALGTTALQWSDLFLAEGAVINFDNGDVTLTQTGDSLAIAGGALSVVGHISSSGTVSASEGKFTTIDIDGGSITGITDLVVADGGTGASTFTDGGVLLGSGTGAITATAALGDGEMLVGDGSTDPSIESGATLRTSIGVGTGDSPQFTAIELGHASNTTIARSGAGDITIEGNHIYRAGGTDVAVADGGTGASTLTDGGVLLGSGTSAITAMAVLSDGEMIVGDGSTDPVAESGATLRTSIGVGTGDDVLFAAISASGDISGSSTSTGSFGRTSTATLDLDSIQGNWTNAGNTVADLGTITTVDINGGTINGITDLAVADGGTGVSTLTDGGVLLGNGAGAIQAMAVLTDGQMIVGDGTTDPVAESGATLRTSIGVGTGDDVVFTSLETSGNVSGSSTSTGSFGAVVMSEVIGNWTNEGNTIADLGTVTTANIDGGTVDGTNVTVGSGKTLNVSAGTLTTSAAQKAAIVEGVGANVDIGAYDFRANTVIADDLTSGRVVFTTTNGQLTDDSDLSFDTATLTATNLTSTGTIKDFGLVSGSSVSTGSIARMKVIDRIDVGNGTSTEPSINFVSDGDTGFFLESADDIGVSLGAVEEFRFANGGNFHADADVVAFSSTVASDARLKENVEDISYGLGDVLQLRGVEFDWKKEGRGHDIGFIAQEVQSVIPEIVKEVDGLNGKESHLTVNYAAVVPVLVESIKTLKEEIDNIKENCKCLKK